MNSFLCAMILMSVASASMSAPTTTVPVHMSPIIESKLDPNCFMCETVIKYAQDYIKQGNTTVKIEDYIHQKCLTWTGQPFICNIIDGEVDNIIQYLENGSLPKEVCSLIKLCSQNIDGCHTEVVCSCCPTQCAVKLVC